MFALVLLSLEHQAARGCVYSIDRRLPQSITSATAYSAVRTFARLSRSLAKIKIATAGADVKQAGADI